MTRTTVPATLRLLAEHVDIFEPYYEKAGLANARQELRRIVNLYEIYMFAKRHLESLKETRGIHRTCLSTNTSRFGDPLTKRDRCNLHQSIGSYSHLIDQKEQMLAETKKAFEQFDRLPPVEIPAELLPKSAFDRHFRRRHKNFHRRLHRIIRDTGG